MLFSVSSSIVAGVAPMLIIRRFTELRTGYLVMAVFFGALYALPWLLVFFGTKSTPISKPEDKPAGIVTQIKSVLRNRAFRCYIGMFLSGMAAADLLLSLLIYYITSVLNRAAEFPLVTGITIVSQLIGSQIWARVAKRTNKIVPLKIGALIWAAGMAICLFQTEASTHWVLYLAAVLIGTGGIACNQVPWSVLPDVIDAGELITGRKEEGVYSGLVTFIRQSANGLMLGLSGFLLQFAGYQVAQGTNGAAVIQTIATVRGLRFLFVFSPLVFLLIALVFAFNYPISRKRFASLISARTLFREGKALDDPEVIADVQAVTGIQAKSLWGKS
jgi:oligogalacturonide transporter